MDEWRRRLKAYRWKILGIGIGIVLVLAAGATAQWHLINSGGPIRSLPFEDESKTEARQNSFRLPQGSVEVQRDLEFKETKDRKVVLANNRDSSQESEKSKTTEVRKVAPVSDRNSLIDAKESEITEFREDLPKASMGIRGPLENAGDLRSDELFTTTPSHGTLMPDVSGTPFSTGGEDSFIIAKDGTVLSDGKITLENAGLQGSISKSPRQPIKIAGANTKENKVALQTKEKTRVTSSIASHKENFGNTYSLESVAPDSSSTNTLAKDVADIESRTNKKSVPRELIPMKTEVKSLSTEILPNEIPFVVEIALVDENPPTIQSLDIEGNSDYYEYSIETESSDFNEMNSNDTFVAKESLNDGDMLISDANTESSKPAEVGTRALDGHPATESTLFVNMTPSTDQVSVADNISIPSAEIAVSDVDEITDTDQIPIELEMNPTHAMPTSGKMQLELNDTEAEIELPRENSANEITSNSKTFEDNIPGKDFPTTAAKEGFVSLTDEVRSVTETDFETANLVTTAVQSGEIEETTNDSSTDLEVMNLDVVPMQIKAIGGTSEPFGVDTEHADQFEEPVQTRENLNASEVPAANLELMDQTPGVLQARGTESNPENIITSSGFTEPTMKIVQFGESREATEVPQIDLEIVAPPVVVWQDEKIDSTPVALESELNAMEPSMAVSSDGIEINPVVIGPELNVERGIVTTTLDAKIVDNLKVKNPTPEAGQAREIYDIQETIPLDMKLADQKEEQDDQMEDGKRAHENNVELAEPTVSSIHDKDESSGRENLERPENMIFPSVTADILKESKMPQESSFEAISDVRLTTRPVRPESTRRRPGRQRKVNPTSRLPRRRPVSRPARRRPVSRPANQRLTTRPTVGKTSVPSVLAFWKRQRTTKTTPEAPNGNLTDTSTSFLHIQGGEDAFPPLNFGLRQAISQLIAEDVGSDSGEVFDETVVTQIPDIPLYLLDLIFEAEDPEKEGIAVEFSGKAFPVQVPEVLPANQPQLATDIYFKEDSALPVNGGSTPATLLQPKTTFTTLSSQGFNRFGAKFPPATQDTMTSTPTVTTPTIAITTPPRPTTTSSTTPTTTSTSTSSPTTRPATSDTTGGVHPSRQSPTPSYHGFHTPQSNRPHHPSLTAPIPYTFRRPQPVTTPTPKYAPATFRPFTYSYNYRDNSYIPHSYKPRTLPLSYKSSEYQRESELANPLHHPSTPTSHYYYRSHLSPKPHPGTLNSYNTVSPTTSTPKQNKPLTHSHTLTSGSPYGPDSGRFISFQRFGSTHNNDPALDPRSVHNDRQRIFLRPHDEERTPRNDFDVHRQNGELTGSSFNPLDHMSSFDGLFQKVPGEKELRSQRLQVPEHVMKHLHDDEPDWVQSMEPAR